MTKSFKLLFAIYLEIIMIPIKGVKMMFLCLLGKIPKDTIKNNTKVTVHIS